MKRGHAIALMILILFAAILSVLILLERPRTSGAIHLEPEYQSQCCRTGYFVVRPRDDIRHGLKCQYAYQHALWQVQNECLQELGRQYTTCQKSPNLQTYYSCEVQLCCS